ncbi:uncharacterized protein LOC105703764 [Orussus abietinus]|uniref:uncharacterized protein LOC105703764 n=1 Tax=Orussus abietinus TaxID=222816 RepID=UPI000625041D|nr:uncharacterized protein LOC105703764 [Orussus abietinus]
MEYDSESSCEDRLKDLETAKEHPRYRLVEDGDRSPGASGSIPLQYSEAASMVFKPMTNVTDRSLSSAVMQYYRKYSQSTNLDQFFSLPVTSTNPDGPKHYYSIYELNPEANTKRPSHVSQDCNARGYVPRERRRWVRPPLIGQSSGAESSTVYVRSLPNPRSPSPELKHETIVEEKRENRDGVTDSAEQKAQSPTSSIASHKPLEWDSGADVGYFNTISQSKERSSNLSTIERIALATGRSVALRLDPEGTTESGTSGKGTAVATGLKSSAKPKAISTPLVGNISGSESEVEITPIVKNHVTGIITGDDIRSEEKKSNEKEKKIDRISDTPTSSHVFKVPAIKYATVGKRCKPKQSSQGNSNPCTSPLKKSSSMHILPLSPSKISLKRSQSDLNLHSKDKNRALLPLLFNSTSSIATVVNKPVTCDKVIQTSMSAYTRESIGVQVSVLEEEKPPLPKRGTSLSQKSPQSILKNSKGTFKVRDSIKSSDEQETRRPCTENDAQSDGNTTRKSSSESSRNGSSPLTPQVEDTENVTGRANSFEYFPGHVYENVPNGSTSRVSSVNTTRSNSTLPNTSSSIDEKLWGDSDSLVRDLERSVNILKSLVDANKCDKQVKKRLIHHVIKRLVTAKYTDDKIERDLEENIPWNPDDARKKVYRAEIIQALTKKGNTTDSSEEWRPQKKKGGCAKKTSEDEETGAPEVANLDSTNSDRFDDKTTDRTEMDGRKARMGLRAEDRGHSSNTPTEANKSESSECFVPQRGYKNGKTKNIFCLKQKCDLPCGRSSSNSTRSDRNGVSLDSVVDDRRGRETPSEAANSLVWPIPFPNSAGTPEWRLESRRCDRSDSGDTKLVSYAEMEKRNQLIWITNEISHLSNLKKLLEQPKKPEKPKISPRKSKRASFKQKPLTVLSALTQRQDGEDDTPSSETMPKAPDENDEASASERWSSHRNLATQHPPASASTRSDRPLGKRNSYTQTATETANAHSKSGGEIVTLSKMENPGVRLTNIYVQTLPQASSPTLMQPQIVHAACPVHRGACVHAPPTSCRCRAYALPPAPMYNLQMQGQPRGETQAVCAHHSMQVQDLYSESCPRENRVDSPNRCQPQNRNDERPNERPFISQPARRGAIAYPEYGSDLADARNGYVKEKDAKNRMNVDKSKAVGPGCECQECKNESCESKESRTKLANGHRPGWYGCERSKSNAKSCRCPRDCSCEARRKEESRIERRNRATCGQLSRRCGCPCHESNETRPYYLNTKKNGDFPRRNGVDSLCGCDENCGCINRTNGSADNYLAKNTASENVCSKRNGGSNRRPGKTESASEKKSCRCCRNCGTASRNGKPCDCTPQYPKPVAYELSFDNGEQKTSVINGSGTQNGEIKSSKTSVNGSFPDADRSRGGGCSCENSKFLANANGPRHKGSLQDCLATNKPGFVDNAETRRRYMTEICQLRQLRKEKRVQLLAMASTSNVVKSPRLPRQTAGAQRRITDEEMKERLRRRYSGLNEVRSKRRQREKQEEARRNKLMATIFCKKLQQKVLRGQVDLSQSVSVISNL